MSTEICKICEEESTPWFTITRCKGHICDSCYFEIKEMIEPNWISVKDNLPNPIKTNPAIAGEIFSQPYVLATDGKFMNVCWCSISRTDYVFMIDSARQFTNVTHWMPLPEPPE